MAETTIVAALRARGWNLEDLATAARRNYPHVTRIARGDAPLTPGMAESLARALGVSSEDLLAGQERVREARRGELFGGRELAEVAR